ncbi:LAQU0S01e03840g1_1 [Lachancea quebecensis]|uniref:mRNA 3'-end-processing protein RNA14 n=1 Tax=Lachancea quebecensis TaxID=1654605 RepID=A0A0P1KLW6_9SACH|nr:LAQU0S01e03840g1_1 [Lachancea quebecensis]
MSSSGQKRKRVEESPLTRQDNTKQPSGPSLLQSAEEASFPRGGASALTPLELKQVANEAASDVLFGSGPATASPVTNDTPRPKKKKKTSPKTAAGTKDAADDDDESVAVIDHLTFRNLPVGTLVLGKVSKVNKHDLCVALSDNLCGFVTLPNISEPFTKLLEDIDESMESDKEASDDESDAEYDNDGDSDLKSSQAQASKLKDLPDLNNFFTRGQWLRCSVHSNSALDKTSKKQKRIELSIEPSATNQLVEEDLARNCTIQCAVKSIEDHGAILDVGMDGITGFISKKEYGSLPNFAPGTVFLANVAKKSGRTVTVNFEFKNKKSKVSHISSVDAVIPGQAVDFLCQKKTSNGVIGKVFGLVDGFLNISQQSSFYSDNKNDQAYPIGSNSRVRIIASLTNKSGNKFVILSDLPRVLSLASETSENSALEAFPVGYTFENCEVKGRDSQYFYLKLNKDFLGRVHLSKTGDQDPSGEVSARVLDYDSFDGYYQLTTDPKTIAVEYLRPIDIPVGTLVPGCEITEVSDKGIKLSIFGGQFKATVPPLHISDIRLVYPERKFKIGSKVKAILINVTERGQLFMSLKKTLVNLDREETELASSFEDIEKIASADAKVAATVDIFKPNGCIVSFLNGLRGFLPNGNISEAYVKRPQDHLRLGQTVIVKVLQHNKEQNRVIVTCKVSSEAALLQKEAIESMVVGRSIIKVVVVEKTKDSIVVEQVGTGLRGVVYVGHLSDSRVEQNRAQLKKLKIGSEFEGLVIDKDERTRVFNLSCKKSLMKDAEKSLLPLNYQDVKQRGNRSPFNGYVKSVSEKGVFVAFNGQFVGLVLPSYAVDSRDVSLSSKFYVNQSVSAFLLRTDDDNERFLLSFKEPKNEKNSKAPEGERSAVNPVDQSIKEVSDFALGKVTKARVKAVKKNQLNVVLSDNLHGRIDISEVFDKFEDIKNPKKPLAAFKKGDVLDVKVIGFHDVKTHKFLPISHRSSKNVLIELSAKPSSLAGANHVTIKDVKLGDSIVGFVNNVSKDIMWLTVSPSLKAKIDFFDLADESSQLGHGIEDSFPLGTALRTKVVGIDQDRNTLSVSARTHDIKGVKDINVGDCLPARLLKITDSYLLLELGENVRGVAFATDALDDYSKSLKDFYADQKNSIVSVKVISIDQDGGKLNLSLRSEEPKDGTAKTHKDLKRGDVVRGLVKKITEKGIFIYLSSALQAFVPVSKLTDSYIKDWKKFFKPMQSVVGKIVNCDDDSHILVTLKESEVDGELRILRSYNDIKVGEIFEGAVKNVTDFGLFVKLDNTVNVTGLAHKTEVADSAVGDLASIFGVGDKVKAIVLKVNPDKKQLSLGLKASYFKESVEKQKSGDGEDVEGSDSSEEEVVEEEGQESDSDNMEVDDLEVEGKEEEPKQPVLSSDGLSLSAGFDWTTSILDQAQEEESSEEEDFGEAKRSKKKKKSVQGVEDQTIDINTRAPESVGDFERMIMGSPNSSVIWMNYMAFQLQLGEIDKAREVAERALKTISFREEAEKLNIWIGLLNLENTFGTESTLNEVFSRACQYMDSFIIHSKLINIFQMSHNFEKASSLFKATAKKFGSEKVSIWVLWSDFLIEQGRTEEARQVLASALQSLPRRNHIEVVRKFAQLEFAKGDSEQGRSLFEGLLADTPKRIDLWNVYLDQEIKLGDKKRVENLFERVVNRKLTRKQAKFFFGKWLEYEEASDDQKTAEYVKAKASEYVEKLNQKPASVE